MQKGARRRPFTKPQLLLFTAGLQQRDLSDQSGYSMGHISDIVKGRRKCPDGLATMLAELTDFETASAFKVLCDEQFIRHQAVTS